MSEQNQSDIDEIAQKATDSYRELTSMEKVPQFARERVGIIRQLLNKEHVTIKKPITSHTVWQLVEPLIRQARIDARNDVISKLRPYIDELEKIKTAEQRELQLMAFARAVERLPEIVAELERGSDEKSNNTDS